MPDLSPPTVVNSDASVHVLFLASCYIVLRGTATLSLCSPFLVAQKNLKDTAPYLLLFAILGAALVVAPVLRIEREDPLYHTETSEAEKVGMPFVDANAVVEDKSNFRALLLSALVMLCILLLLEAASLAVATRSFLRSLEALLSMESDSAVTTSTTSTHVMLSSRRLPASRAIRYPSAVHMVAKETEVLLP